MVNTCVINISTPGALGLAATGTTLSTETTGGVEAILAVVATGAAPTLQFAAPQITGPGASTAGATEMIGYTSTGGASQAMTSGTSTYVMNRLLDNFTVKAQATNSGGFTSGLYSVSSTVTCQ